MAVEKPPDGNLKPARLTSLSLRSGSDQLIDGAGRIIQEIHYWEVSYSLSREGWIDIDYREHFGELERAHERIGELVRPNSPPADAAKGSNDEVS